MEASLLPSPEIAALNRKAILAATRVADPVCAELRKEFDVRCGNSWVVVLDGKGETLASFMGDCVECTDDAAKDFPVKLAAEIEKMLGRESVQELDRRWRASPEDPQALDAFADRMQAMMQAMNQYHPLAQRCDEALPKALAGPVRDTLRVWAFLARADDDARYASLQTHQAFLDEGVRLLAELPGHPRAGEAVQALYMGGLNFGLDLPAKHKAVLAGLREAARAPDPKALETHIEQLEKLCASREEAYRKMAENPAQGDYAKAMLGDSEAVMRHFDKPDYARVPAWRFIVMEAKARKP